MQRVLLWNMLAFCMFALVIAWFRYELERTGQKINLLHIHKAARGVGAMVAPALFNFFLIDEQQEKMVQHRYMVAGYIAVWTIYIGYLLFLFGKLQRLRREADALGLGQN